MYTINQVAQLCDLSPHTIRYYDKEGLLPFIARSKSGNRMFSDTDLELMKLVCCLKNTGMPIKEIKNYMDMVVRGGETSEARKQMMIEHRREVVRQIDGMKKNLNIIDLKIKFYEAH